MLSPDPLATYVLQTSFGNCGSSPCFSSSSVAYPWRLHGYFLVFSNLSGHKGMLQTHHFFSVPSPNTPPRNFAMAAAMIMNSNSLPVALLQSLALSVPGLEWGQDDTVDAIVGRALTYLLLGGTMGQFVSSFLSPIVLKAYLGNSQIRWSLGVHLLTKAVPLHEIEQAIALDDENGSFAEEVEPIEDVPHEDMPRVPMVFDPEANPIVNPNVRSENEDVSQPVWSWRNTSAERMVHAAGKIWRRVIGFMTPPLWAAVVSLVVALNQPLRYFIDTTLWPLRGAITQAGNCSIPLTLVVLGAYFHRPADKSMPPLLEDFGPRRAGPLSQLRKLFCLESESRMGALRLEPDASMLGDRGEGSTIFVLILARMIITPLILLPLVVLGALRGSPGVFKEYVLLSNSLMSTTYHVTAPVRFLY